MASREGHQLDGALHLDPVSVEGVGEHEERGPWPPLQVLGLPRRLAGGDDDLVTVHAGRYEGELGAAVPASGGQHGPVMLPDEFQGVVELHGAEG